MKTLIFTLEYPPFKGGIANYCENLIKYWPEPGNIFVLNNNENKLINKKLPFLKWLPCLWYLWQKIKKHKINHIIIHHILPLGTAIYLISKITKISYSIVLHGMDIGTACSLPKKRWIIKKILNNANNIICGSNYTAELTKKFLDSEKLNKVIVINPGVDHVTHNIEHVAQIKEKYNLQNKIILLSVGRLIKRKGFDKTIEAMPRVLKQTPNLIYVIWGHGPEAENLKQQAENLKLNNIIFMINIVDVNDEQKNAWYNLADIFIMPAREIGKKDFEGFGIVYLEANMAGKPVIAGDSGGIRDVVVDNVTGLLVNPENTIDIANAIIKLTKNENLRKKLGEFGKKRTIKEFKWEQQVEKIYKQINNISSAF